MNCVNQGCFQTRVVRVDTVMVTLAAHRSIDPSMAVSFLHTVTYELWRVLATVRTFKSRFDMMLNDVATKRR